MNWGRPRGGDEIVTPKNGRSRPEKCGSISHGRVFFCLKPAELKKISRLLIQRRIARRFDQKTKADRATFIDGNTETGVGGCIRTGKSKFEIGENWIPQCGRQIGKTRGRFSRQTRRASVRFHSRKANRPDCGRAWNTEIGRQGGRCFQFWLMTGVGRAMLNWRQNKRFCLW